MNELEKLLENAGILLEAEDQRYIKHANTLNAMSDIYRFYIHDSGQIDVYAEYQDEGWMHTAKYDNFDQMLKMHGHQ